MVRIVALVAILTLTQPALSNCNCARVGFATLSGLPSLPLASRTARSFAGPKSTFLPTCRGGPLASTRLRLRGRLHGNTATQAVMSSAGSQAEQKFFAFEGVIGAGKSTLLAELEARGVKIVAEPLERWQETGIFAAFYGDMTRWSYTFQMQAFISRVKSIEQAFETHASIPNFVGERSWFADSFVFEPLLHRDGHISDIEHAAYREWWEWLQCKIPKTSGIIYLRASPETCLERIQRRSREEEAGIPLSYLEGLFQQHEKWLMQKMTPYGTADPSVPVLVLDADVEFKSDPAKLKQMLQDVQDFIADPTAYSARVSQRMDGEVRGSVDTAGWQAFKMDAMFSKNTTEASA